MAQAVNLLAEQLRARFDDDIQDCVVARGEVTLVIAAARLQAIGVALRDEAPFAFGMLVDIAGVDYLTYGRDEWQTQPATRMGFSRGVEQVSYARFSFTDAPTPPRHEGPRFAVVYHLLSLTHNQRLRLKVFCEDDDFPIVDSVIDIWASANWFEREAFDLFGIVFEGHPDLRRILTDYGFIGHPFRKNFPLIGNVEVRYDPEQARVIYQPVTIEPRVLVPKVIRGEDQAIPDQPGEALTGDKTAGA